MLAFLRTTVPTASSDDVDAVSDIVCVAASLSVGIAIGIAYVVDVVIVVTPYYYIFSPICSESVTVAASG